MDRHIAAIHVCLYNGFYTVNTVAVRIGIFKASCSHEAFRVIFPVSLPALGSQSNKTSDALTVSTDLIAPVHQNSKKPCMVPKYHVFW